MRNSSSRWVTYSEITKSTASTISPFSLIRLTCGLLEARHTTRRNLATYLLAARGLMFGESVGGGLVNSAEFFAHVGDNGWLSVGLDASSRSYIALGAKLGASDKQAGRTGDVCSCGGK